MIIYLTNYDFFLQYDEDSNSSNQIADSTIEKVVVSWLLHVAHNYSN